MRHKSFVFFVMALLVASCADDPLPLPYGYMRIGLPQGEYNTLDLECNYSFEMNAAAQWEAHKENDCWGDVYYPDLKARIQLTYKPIGAENSRDVLFKEAEELAMRHTVVADGIKEQQFENEYKDVYGLVFQMIGNTASNTQFFLTDSTDHFIRGALYFYAPPNADSLKPVNAFMFDEIVRLIETFEWKKK
ncbi:MAG: gliding motility lipoprotein GldD [Schleiferiaceae bacterium]|nr:gliding motility lipoprotein GldD [Schleiferiaceae bacterium]